MEAYAKKFEVYDKIRFGVQVVHIQRRQGNAGTPMGWTLETSTGETISCDKLIYAAGLYSSPKPIPMLAFDENKPYTGVSIHTVDLGRRQAEICSDASVKDVVVVGGCKSAVEACHLFLTAKKRIHWIVRPSDQGAPFVVFDSNNAGMLAAASTRLFAAFSPSIFSTKGFWYTFLHSGSVFIGSLLVWAFWSLTSYKIHKDVNYEQSENGKRVKPKGGTFFYDSPYVSALYKTHPFFEAFHADDPDLITVHRVVPERLHGREMIVKDALGEEKTIKADAVIWAIGFQPGTEVFDKAEASELGIPVPRASTSPPEPLFNTPYDKRIQSLFPKTLTRRPRLGTSISKPRHTRWSLFRQVIPAKSFASGDRTLAFTGIISAGQTPVMCELTSLWAVAWLEDLFTSVPRPLQTGVVVTSSIPPGNEENSSQRADCPGRSEPSENPQQQLLAKANEEIALIHAWMFRRTGIRGMLNPDILLECQSYFDLLCTDLGVAVERKKLKYHKRNNEKQKLGLCAKLKAWFWEFVEPYRAPDYQGVVDEFLDRRDETLRKVK